MHEARDDMTPCGVRPGRISQHVKRKRCRVHDRAEVTPTCITTLLIHFRGEGRDEYRCDGHEAQDDMTPSGKSVARV